MKQMLLLPDPRPLVERLGTDFFRQAPPRPGVYLMRDGAETVLYVGKARNLRRRLASYRSANPDRVPRRQLRLLRAVRRIELQECATEQAALAREAELLRNLRPRFNRAGTWPGTPHVLGWRLTGTALELRVGEALGRGWQGLRRLGGAAYPFRAALVRLLWCGLYPERGLGGMPQGWVAGNRTQTISLSLPHAAWGELREPAAQLEQLFDGKPAPLLAWAQERALQQLTPFEAAVRTADEETLTDFAQRWAATL